MPQYPGIGFPPDSQTGLWRDVSRNFFEIAQIKGYGGTLEPNSLDAPINAMRKATFYSAFVVDNP